MDPRRKTAASTLGTTGEADDSRSGPRRLEMVNRKLVRPNLAEIKEKFAPSRTPMTVPQAPGAGREASQGGGAPAPRRRPVPPEQTSAEAFYYLKQMNNRTPMVVVLDNGEQLRGRIEWYDRSCIKVNRDDGNPNLLVFKHAIKYVYKQEEEKPGGAPAPPPAE